MINFPFINLLSICLAVGKNEELQMTKVVDIEGAGPVFAQKLLTEVD